jgi:hypothetical protein
VSGDEFNERDELMELLLETPAGPERDRRLADLDEETRATFARLLDVDDLMWESNHGAPPLQEDPVAAMLGLVPDPSFRLDSTAFTQLCSRSKVKPARLAERLRARGWEVDAADVFRWQMSVASEVSPALIRAIADEIRTTPDKLAAPPSAQQGALDTLADLVAATKRFGDLVERFALAQRISPSMAQSVLRTRVLATAQRGREPAVEQMLESLEALVRALEEE